MTKLVLRFRHLLDYANVRGIISSIGVKVGAAVSSFLLLMMAARVLDDATFGQFAMIFSIASMLGIFAAFGQEMFVIRLWNEYGAAKKYGLLKGGIIFGLGICAAGGILSAAAIGAFLVFTQTWSLAISAGLFVLIYTVLLFTSHLCRAMVGVPMGDGTRDVVAVLAPNILLVFCFVLGASIALEWIFAAYAFGFLIAIIVQTAAMLKKVKDEEIWQDKGPIEYDIKAWMPPSIRLWVATILESSNQYLEVVLIGFLMSPTAAGIYFVATRLANGFATAADAFNMFGSKHIPDLFYRKEHVQLAGLLRTMALMMIVVVGGGLLTFAVAGHWILGLFSASYSAYYAVLLLLCIGTAGLAATGPATQMLMLTGHEGRYLAIIAISVSIRIVGFLILIPVFEIYGAAIANAASLVFMAIFVGVNAKALTGHDPSILRLLKPVPKTPPVPSVAAE